MFIYSFRFNNHLCAPTMFQASELDVPSALVEDLLVSSGRDTSEQLYKNHEKGCMDTWPTCYRKQPTLKEHQA